MGTVATSDAPIDLYTNHLTYSAILFYTIPNSTLYIPALTGKTILTTGSTCDTGKQILLVLTNHDPAFVGIAISPRSVFPLN